MRYPTSVIYLIALYAHHVQGLKVFKSRQLYQMARDAQQWYELRIPQFVMAKKARILRKHGFNQSTWDDVLAISGYWAWSPDKRTTECNRELRQLFSTVTLINSLPGSYDYVRQLVNQARKRKVPVLQYVHKPERGAYTYCINPDFLNPPDIDFKGSHKRYPHGTCN
jgi:hypothetical protein